jgi:hypothetical protein
MINGFQYFSVEDHPLKERIWNATQWLRQANQKGVEPHTPWISLTWLGYRALEGKFSFEDFKVIQSQADLPTLEHEERARWECSLVTVYEYLRVLRNFQHDSSLDHYRWSRAWPSTIINILRQRAIHSCSRYTEAKIQASDLMDATTLWGDACVRMGQNSEYPFNILEHHKAVEALQLIGMACWKAGVVKVDTYPDLLKHWKCSWRDEWYHKACRKVLEHSNWHP